MFFWSSDQENISFFDIMYNHAIINSYKDSLKEATLSKHY